MADSEPATAYWLTALLDRNAQSLEKLPIAIRETEFSYHYRHIIVDTHQSVRSGAVVSIRAKGASADSK